MYKKVIVLNINIEMVSFITFTAHANAHEKAFFFDNLSKIKLTFVSVSTLKIFTKTQLMIKRNSLVSVRSFQLQGWNSSSWRKRKISLRVSLRV